MAQLRSKQVQRQSDLQPVYDLLDALHPARLRAAFTRLDHRTRWILVTSVAGVVLLWTVLSLMQLGISSIRASSGPFLLDALRAPYNLEARLIPAPDMLMTLPVQVGEYLVQPETVMMALVPTLTEGSDIATVEAPALTFAPSSPAAQCMVKALNDAGKSVCGMPNPLYLTGGNFVNGAGLTTQMIASQYASAADARQAVRALFRETRQQAVTGNYAIGVGAVDYFFGSTAENRTFAWGHGNWVYLVTSASNSELEAVLNQLPF